MRKLGIAILVVAALMLAAVLVSLIPSDQWFIRTVDLVREPMSYIAAIMLVVALFIKAAPRWAAVSILGLVIVINVWRIWPYSALAGTDLALADTAAAQAGSQCFSAMAVNVKVKNEGYDAVAQQIRRHDPDLLFLMETDARWIAELEPVISAYSHVERHPQPEAFGLVFATRLPVQKSNVVENTHRDTPTLYATVQPQGAGPIEFIGLHPKPPLPAWDTDLRDENIVNAGVQTPDRLPDALVMGDFNDVPWSRTTSKFREAGEWRDPRIGRGTYPTFPANLLLAGWPLDQIMVKGELEVASFEIMPDNGSDHRAILTTVCMN
ncbi:MAG: endonuclease/exonuclease/phosphatase family protein [Pacificimonas sp.]|jgi:endonuclease/exonuclease/phosphatase (EEP) superfamily protein YafD|nr:endonuclease/exonuclease/phosphatase family protein [Pacificimonas sp.]